jgi:uncharacterized protein involved in cysteine biosynthesis
MLEAAIKGLTQILSPPFRAVLGKAIGLALVLIVAIGIALQRLLVWLATAGETWAESVLGGAAHTPLEILSWILAIAAGLGILVGSIFLMPAVTALVGSFFVDEIALEVERTHYPISHRVPRCRWRPPFSRASRRRRSRCWSISLPCRSCCLPAPAW